MSYNTIENDSDTVYRLKQGSSTPQATEQYQSGGCQDWATQEEVSGGRVSTAFCIHSCSLSLTLPPELCLAEQWWHINAMPLGPPETMPHMDKCHGQIVFPGTKKPGNCLGPSNTPM